MSSLVNNLADGIYKLNVNTNMIIKKVKLAELNTKNVIVIASLNMHTLKII